MRRRDMLAAAAGGAVAAGWQDAARAAGVDVSRLVRTALFVSDLDAAKRFYRDLLGLDQVFYEGEFKGEAAGLLLGIPPTALTKAFIVKAEGPPFGMIGLFEVTGHKLRRVSKRRGAVNIGEGVLVFYVPNLDPLVERLRGGGYEIVCPPVKLIRSREMTFYGPDGVLINAIERDWRML